MRRRSAPSHGPPRITKARSSVFWSAVIAGMSWWDKAPNRPRPPGNGIPLVAFRCSVNKSRIRVGAGQPSSRKHPTSADAK